ncbi:MAG: phosphatidylinositol mannoside acyltransferase [Actinobacteria bacterium]|nr:phosphatidylinositol mannoside acyltransferase [Actinomycetota bacterium]
MPPRYERPPGEGRLIQLVYYAFVGGSALARALPERMSYGLARAAGRISARISKKRDQVRANLARISGHPLDSPELDHLVVKAYQSYARYWLETFALVREDQAFFLDRFRSPTGHRLFDYVAQGKGAIVVVGHLGNWDAAGAWVGANGHLLVTVAEVLKPRRMFDFFVAHRAQLGMVIHPAERGATLKLAEAVENGAVVAILGDRDLKGRGPVVEFFGEQVPFPAGPASVALKTGAPVFIAGVYGVIHEDGKRGWIADISEPIEIAPGSGPERVQAITQQVARELERCVAKHPEEWHVFQPFWPSDRAAAAR